MATPLAGQISFSTTLAGSFPGGGVGFIAALSGAYPVSSLTEYTLLASFLADSVGRATSVTLNWQTGSGAPIYPSVTGSAVYDTTSGWGQVLGNAMSPSNAAFVVVQVSVAGTASGEIHYVDCVGLFPGVVSVWAPPNYVAPTSNDLWRFATLAGVGTAYRVATLIPLQGSWTDLTPASGVDYQYEA